MNRPASRPESSVLFSLRELRDIETSRIAEERAAEQAARAAEQRAREAAAARAAAVAAAAEQARVAAEEAALAARRRQLEEDARRVEETEARLRAEALVRLETERLACEIELRREEIRRQRPRWLMGVAAALAAVALGAGLLAVRASDDVRAGQEKTAEARQQAAAAARALAARQAAYRAMEEDYQRARQALAEAKTAAEKAAAAARLKEAELKRPPRRPGGRPPATGDSGRGSGDPGIEVCADQVLCD